MLYSMLPLGHSHLLSLAIVLAAVLTVEPQEQCHTHCLPGMHLHTLHQLSV